MHILFLSHYFPPEVNAPATRTFEHAKRWVQKGHRVTVITCAPNCPSGVVYQGYKNRILQREIVEGIRVVRVWTFIAPNKGFLKRIANYLSYMISAVLTGLFQKKVDVVIATSPQFFCGWAGVLLHWIRRLPFVLEIRDIWPESIVTVGAMKKSLVIRGLEKMELAMYRNAHHIIAAGHGYKKNMTDKGVPEKKITVILNGVDAKEIQSKVSSQNANALRKTTSSHTLVESTKEKMRSSGKFVCAYIGTVGMAHGLQVVLEAAQLEKQKEKSDLHFWIVGDGASREDLEREARKMNLDNVLFTGRLPKEQMPDVVSSCDACLVHLRKTDLFETVVPSKIFEFMALNTPIIMGVKGESRNYVVEAGAGVCMEPEDPESLLECIREIRSKGREAYRATQYVQRHFDRNELADRMLERIEGVMQKKRGDLRPRKDQALTSDQAVSS